MTNISLDDLFFSLESSAADLHDASDLGNQALADAEKRLIAANIGFEVWYSSPLERSDAEGYSGADATRTEIVDLLGFAQAEDKWCLATKRVKLVSGFFEGDTGCPYTDSFLESPPVPLLKQSRNLRIKAVAALPMFLEELTRAIQDMTQNLSQATEGLVS